MIKVAMIGAGSVVFSKNLTGDILSFPEFRSASFSYMDVDPTRLKVGAALCAKAALTLGASPKINATQDRRTALADADFVINMMQVGGFDSTLLDFEIPRKYGLNFTIADTTGPGGLFRALRTFPVLRGLCRDMEEVCPKAMLLNYANPMSMNMQTITRTSAIASIGLCHSVQGTLCEMMGYLGENPADVAFVCAGINHMAFYLRLTKQGVDLYPRLFDAMKSPGVYGTNAVRFELMKRLGYFVTESSEHNAEYSPWFMGHGVAHSARYNVPIDEYLRRCDCSIDEFSRLTALSESDTTIEVRRSREYGSDIIHSMVSGTPAVVYGNLPNRGAISNLPASAIVEAATLVDRAGPRLTTVGELPPQLVGYIQPHVTQHELFIRAAMEERREHIYQAAMFDPLTNSVLTTDQIVEMCDELIAAHGCIDNGGLLPPLDTQRTLVATSGKSFPNSDPSKLREDWCHRQRGSRADYITHWHVLGPFVLHAGCRKGLEAITTFELRGSLGIVDLTQTFVDDARSLQWNPAVANDRGFVDLSKTVGRVEWAVAYAYAEVQSTESRKAVLRFGSDDGIKVWLNGDVIHHHEVGRAYRLDSDVAPALLKAGTNRFLVKIDNYTGGWGFGVAVPKP